MPRETETEYYSGQGVTYLSEKDASGNLLGYRDVGNVPDLKLSFSTNTIEHKESRTGNRLVDMRLATDKSCTASITLEGFDADTLKAAMYATATEAAAGTGVEETVVARLGKVVPLSKIKISAVVVKDETETATYVAGKNYTVDTETGTLYIMDAEEQAAAGAGATVIADADDLVVTYNHAAQVKVEAFQDSQKTYSLMFLGLNTAKDNQPVRITIPNFRPDPLKDLSMISNELQQFVMEGAALADTATGKFVTIEKL